MVENKQLVEILNDWGIDHQNLLHVLQSAHKDSLIGLIEGTHEIQINSKGRSILRDQENFVCILEKTIIIPDMTEIIAEANRFWGKSSSLAKTSLDFGITTPFKKGMEKRIKVLSVKGINRLEHCLSFIQRHGGIPGNGPGLIIAKKVFGLELPDNVDVFGLDVPENLPLNMSERLAVPCIKKDLACRSSFFHTIIEWKSKEILSSAAFVMFCD